MFLAAYDRMDYYDGDVAANRAQHPHGQPFEQQLPWPAEVKVVGYRGLLLFALLRQWLASRAQLLGFEVVVVIITSRGDAPDREGDYVKAD